MMSVVNEPDKNTNWKQFTTQCHSTTVAALLSMNPIKIQIESNSQRHMVCIFRKDGCQWTR